MTVLPKASAADNGPGGNPGTGKVEKLLRRYEIAKSIWMNWKPLWEECYRYALPQREQFDITSPGAKNTSEIFDDTAVVTLPEMASKISAALIPDYQRWASFAPGPEVPDDKKDLVARELEPVSDRIWHTIDNSNFYAEAHESFIEVGVGTGVLEIWPGDAVEIIRCKAIPMTQVVLEIGPYGRIHASYRMRKVQARDAKTEWPDAVWPEEFDRLEKENPEKQVDFLCATYRDWTDPAIERHSHCVIWLEKRIEVYERTWEGLGSSPVIPFTWSQSAGEVYGRGPMINVLPSVKTANLVQQLLLDNAELHVAGLWQLDTNGTINPNTIQLIPGTIIPKMPGSTGLEAIQPQGNFDLAQFILEDMRNNIKRGLYADQFAPIDQTPMSATEVALRQQDLAERIGAAFGRLQKEFVIPVIQRIVWILREKGLIQLPAVNGRAIVIRPISPLARAQRNEEINAVDRYMSGLVNYYGPEMVALVTKPPEMADYLADLHGIRKSVVSSADEVKAKLAQAAQMQQAMAQQGAA